MCGLVLVVAGAPQSVSIGIDQSFVLIIQLCSFSTLAAGGPTLRRPRRGKHFLPLANQELRSGNETPMVSGEWRAERSGADQTDHGNTETGQRKMIS